MRGTREGEEEGVRGGKNRTGSAYRQRFSRGLAEENWGGEKKRKGEKKSGIKTDKEI